LNQLAVKLRKSPRRVFGAALCVVGVVLLVASVAGGMSGAPPDTSQPRATAIGAPEVSPGGEPTEPSTSNEQPVQQKTPKPAQSPETQTNTQSTYPQPATTENPPQPEPATIEVSLTINNSYKGKVSLPDGSNQCDVLRQALSDGLISNLDIRYSNQHKTHGVYIIDGIGDNNAIWWTYKVDGKSPPVGCSKVEARSGQSVEWEYQK